MVGSRFINARALVGVLIVGIGCQQSAPAPAPEPSTGFSRSEARAVSVPGRSQLDNFSFDVPLPGDSGVCVRETAHDGVGTMFLVYHPDRANAIAVSTVVVDSAGQLTSFSERRGRTVIHGVPGGTRAQFDSALADARRTTRSSTLVLTFATGQALLSNDGGGRPDQNLLVPISDVANDPRFDRPLARARMIRDRCSAEHH